LYGARVCNSIEPNRVRPTASRLRLRRSPGAASAALAQAGLAACRTDALNGYTHDKWAPHSRSGRLAAGLSLTELYLIYARMKLDCASTVTQDTIQMQTELLTALGPFHLVFVTPLSSLFGAATPAPLSPLCHLFQKGGKTFASLLSRSSLCQFFCHPFVTLFVTLFFCPPFVTPLSPLCHHFFCHPFITPFLSTPWYDQPFFTHFGLSFVALLSSPPFCFTPLSPFFITHLFFHPFETPFATPLSSLFLSPFCHPFFATPLSPLFCHPFVTPYFCHIFVTPFKG
jgi:hypothetical protein